MHSNCKSEFYINCKTFIVSACNFPLWCIPPQNAFPSSSYACFFSSLSCPPTSPPLPTPTSFPPSTSNFLVIQLAQPTLFAFGTCIWQKLFNKMNSPRKCILKNADVAEMCSAFCFNYVMRAYEFRDYLKKKKLEQWYWRKWQIITKRKRKD